MFDCCVCSPPYADGEKGHPSLGSVNKDAWGTDGRDIARRRGVDGEYGTTHGQLGAMKPGFPCEAPMTDVETLDFPMHLAYGSGWTDNELVPEAFSHPAKAAKGLLRLIFDHLFERGYLKRGGCVVDPFGGVGTTGIESASRGCRFVGCELEPKFHALAERNFDLHRRVWEAAGDPQPRMVCGDSRRLQEIIMPVLAEAVVSSPPFADCLCNVPNRTKTKLVRPNLPPAADVAVYLRERRKASALSRKDVAKHFPSRTDGLTGCVWNWENGVNMPTPEEWLKLKTILDLDGRFDVGILTVQEVPVNYNPTTDGRGINGDYGTSEGQLGAMTTGEPPASGDSRNLRALLGTVLGEAAVSSPPFTQSLGSQDKKFRSEGLANGAGKYAQNRSPESVARLTADYGTTPGQLGSMTPGEAPADSCVSSPPYEGSMSSAGNGIDWSKSVQPGHGSAHDEPRYSADPSNVGNTSGDTFWQAARQIVEQTALCLKDGACSAWIVKAYVKSKKLVPFPEQWAALLTECGFEVVCVARAWLVQETKEPGLFEKEVVTRVARKSFFRRLAESKGSPPIDFEVVIFARKR